MNELITNYPTTKIVVATKPLVDKLLQMNTRNRSVNKKGVQRIVEDIKKDRFMLTASGVGVSKTGFLLDGQHRLMAIAQSGYPKVSFVLTTGLEEESMQVIDTHSRRSIDAILNICFNETLLKGVSATIQSLLQFQCYVSNEHMFVNGQHIIAMEKRIDFLDRHKDQLTESVGLIQNYPSAVRAPFFVFYKHDPDLATEFASGLNTGANLDPQSPILRLREHCAKHKATTSAEKLALLKMTVAAITKFVNKEPCKLLRQQNNWSEFPYRF